MERKVRASKRAPRKARTAAPSHPPPHRRQPRPRWQASACRPGQYRHLSKGPHPNDGRHSNAVSREASKCTIKRTRGKTDFMYEVTVEDTFAAGHFLRNYKGKCENPHGHNYKIRVTLAGAELDKAGLLLDFKDLKDVMKHAIDRLDHQMINDIEPFTVLNPSAENLAKYFYDETNH